MDIGSLYTDYYSKMARDSKTNRLSSNASKDMSGSTDEELMEVCKEFESYFVEQVLKQAMDTFTTGDEMSSGAMSTLQGFYKDNLVKEYSTKITDNEDMGLAKILYDQMKRNYSTDQIKASEVINDKVVSTEPVKKADNTEELEIQGAIKNTIENTKTD